MQMSLARYILTEVKGNVRKHCKASAHLHTCIYSQVLNKPLSILPTKLLTHIKQGLQKYCETTYSINWINQMSVLKNSKE